MFIAKCDSTLTIVSLAKQNDDYKLQDNEFNITEELYNLLSSTLETSQYKVKTLDSSPLTVEDVQKVETIALLYLASFSLKDGKKWLTGASISSYSTPFSYDKYIVIDEEAYNFILENNVENTYYVSINTTKCTLQDIKKVEYTSEGIVETEGKSIYVSPININNGKKWLTGVQVLSANKGFSYDSYASLTEEAYNLLKSSELDLGLNVYYVDESVINVDVSDIKKNEDSDTLQQEDNLELVKKQKETQALSLLRSRLDDTTNIAFANFIILNNKLLDKGFVITDENREDKYLEIVNKDDEQLLDTLSSYLEAYDNLRIYVDYYQYYIRVKENIRSAFDLEEVNAAFDEYNKRFI